MIFKIDDYKTGPLDVTITPSSPSHTSYQSIADGSDLPLKTRLSTYGLFACSTKKARAVIHSETFDRLVEIGKAKLSFDYGRNEQGAIAPLNLNMSGQHKAFRVRVEFCGKPLDFVITYYSQAGAVYQQCIKSVPAGFSGYLNLPFTDFSGFPQPVLIANVKDIDYIRLTIIATRQDTRYGIQSFEIY